MNRKMILCFLGMTAFLEDSGALYGGLGGVDLAKLPLAAQQVIPCGDVVGRGLTELEIGRAHV